MRESTRFRITSALAVLLIIWSCGTKRIGTKPIGSTAETTLAVALYPYVPRVEQFKAALASEWGKVQPDIALNFLDWDGGYSDNPPAGVDVYVFDAMFFEYFRSQGWLEAMSADEIDNLDDFVPYAIQGVRLDSQYYAIPQLGCANVLFYEKDDEPLASANTLREVKSALSQCTYTSKIPPDRRGLMVDMAGGTTSAALYLDAVYSLNGQFPLPLPWNQSQIDPNAMADVRSLLAMASYENGTTDQDVPYQHGQWFGQGWGRAFIGFTESMSAITPEARDNIAFKVMPLSDKVGSPMFYADVIGVHPATRDRGTRGLAVQLANVMASAATMVASTGPDGSNTHPQYLMVARPSVFQELAHSFPIYNEMLSLITTNNPVMFKVSDQSRDWLTAMKSTIVTDTREDYPCGCDFSAAEFIPNDAAARPICEATCADHGSWNGQWTNEFPAAPAGMSACGCTVCPSP